MPWRVMDHERAKPWADQVERLRRGPVAGPFAWRTVREPMYIREYLVHHENVRRANGLGPRNDVPELHLVAWQKATTVGRFALKRASMRADHGINIVRPDGEWFVAVSGASMIEVHGEPIELLLFALGRRAAAQVDLRGSDEAVATLLAGDWKV